MPGRGGRVRPEHLGAARRGRPLLLHPHRGELGHRRPRRELHLHQGVGEFTGSLKTGTKSLKPGQKTYPNGANAVYEALWANQPEAETVEEDLDACKAQADAVATALDAHLDGLRGIEGTETGRLRTRLEKTAGHWKDVAKAGDADAFYIAYDPAFTGLDPGDTAGARKELGLATTVPVDDAEIWAD